MVKGLTVVTALACAAIYLGQNTYPAKLVLLEKVTSGMKVGTKVPMIVQEDVKDKAVNVLVKADTPAFGEVVKSRRAGTLSNMLDTPAKLAIQVGNTFDPDHKPLKLQLATGEKELDLTRENTSLTQVDPKIAEACKDEQTRQLLKQLVQSFDSNSPSNLTKEQIATLQKQATQLSLTNTAQLCQSGQLSALTAFMQNLRSGAAFAGPAGVSPVLLASCALEIADLCHHSAGYFGGRFMGRNISALPGMVVEAEVVKP